MFLMCCFARYLRISNNHIWANDIYSGLLVALVDLYVLHPANQPRLPFIARLDAYLQALSYVNHTLIYFYFDILIYRCYHDIMVLLLIASLICWFSFIAFDGFYAWTHVLLSNISFYVVIHVNSFSLNLCVCLICRVRVWSYLFPYWSTK